MKSKPIRMCIACRTRFVQDNLYRFAIDHNRLVMYNGIGRSIYLCQSCIVDTKKNKKIKSILQNKFKIQNSSEMLSLLKEKMVNG